MGEGDLECGALGRVQSRKEGQPRGDRGREGPESEEQAGGQPLARG